MALASPSATTSCRKNIVSPQTSTPFCNLVLTRSQKLSSFNLFSQHDGLCCAYGALSQQTHVRSSSIANSSVSGIELLKTSTASWEKFAENVSGEWDGFGADFTTLGEPIELPESVVPEAYREWEVKVFDWQTQCPTLAKTGEQILEYRNIKLLPTVGCEADAATRYSIDERSIGDSSSKVEAFVYHPSGCYTAVWPLLGNGVERLVEIEYCLINPQDRESRVRISQVIAFKDDNKRIVLKGNKVFCEQWYGPFRNGDQLGGCSIRDSAFASTPPVNASEVIGVWEGSASIATFHDTENNFQELVEAGTRTSVRDENINIVRLPKQLWCSLQEQENGEILSEAGWLYTPGESVVSSCIFSRDQNLKNISVSRETLQRKDV